ncbi:hypothetical protein BaRGS_00003599, partial [Batillaria attramentaria]
MVKIIEVQVTPVQVNACASDTYKVREWHMTVCSVCHMSGCSPCHTTVELTSPGSVEQMARCVMTNDTASQNNCVSDALRVKGIMTVCSP